MYVENITIELGGILKAGCVPEPTSLHVPRECHLLDTANGVSHNYTVKEIVQQSGPIGENISQWSLADAFGRNSGPGNTNHDSQSQRCPSARYPDHHRMLQPLNNASRGFENLSLWACTAMEHIREPPLLRMCIWKGIRCFGGGGIIFIASQDLRRDKQFHPVGQSELFFLTVDSIDGLLRIFVAPVKVRGRMLVHSAPIRNSIRRM